MKNRSGFLQFLLCSIMISGFAGCDSPNPQKQPYETLVFKVDETRLEPVVTDTVLKITIAAPKNWKKIDNSMFAQVVNKLDTQLTTQDLQIVPRWIFLNEGSRALCVVSKLNDVEIAPDKTLEEGLLMTETLETLAKRVNQLEKVVAEMTLQLSQVVDISKPAEPKGHKTTDEQYEAQAIQKMREHLGIADIELMPLEELRKSMARHGIRAEDNEFSRAIIEERGK